MSQTRTAVLLLLALAALPAGAVEVELLSRVPPRRASATAGGDSGEAALSADGRFLVFLSTAENLVAGVADRNHGSDVFLFDRATGETVLVSKSAGPEPATANRPSASPAISASGRFVVFTSPATDLVPGQIAPKRRNDVFLWDRSTGRTELVSHAVGSLVKEGNGASGAPALSADGRFVAFESRASDLVPGIADTSGSDIFLYEREAGTVELVSRSAVLPRRTANGASTSPSVSADGRFVAYASRAWDTVADLNDRNGVEDIFLSDRVAETTVLVSHAAGAARVAADGISGFPLVSADGRFVAYWSEAVDLVPGQSTASRGNAFLFDRRTGTSVLVSHAPASPTAPADALSAPAAINANGLYVLFGSHATNLVSGQEDQEGTGDVFLYDRSTGTVTLVSRSHRSPTAAGDGDSFPEALSGNGRFVAFVSFAPDLVTNVADGRGADVFLWDRVSGRTVERSVSGDDPGRPGNGVSAFPVLSANGRFLAYTTTATDLVLGALDANRAADVILEDRAGRDRTLVTRHAPGLASATSPGAGFTSSISADGRFVVFENGSSALIPGQVDANGGEDVFLSDRMTGTTTLVSHADASPLATGNGASRQGLISADGRFVAYASFATDLVPGQTGGSLGNANVFLWERETGTTTLVSHAVLSLPTVANGNSFLGDFGTISADGSTVIFFSRSTDLVFAQPAGSQVVNAFAWDRASGRVTLVSGVDGSVTGSGANSDVLYLAASADGRIVAFTTAARLVTTVADDNGPGPLGWDVFVHDRNSQTTTLLSRAAGAAEAVGGLAPRVSADGRFVSFLSGSGRVVSGQSDTAVGTDLFLHDRASGTTRLVSHVAGSPTTGAGGLGTSGMDAAGRFLAFVSDSPRLVAGQVDGNGRHDVFLYDRETGRVSLVSRAAGTEATAGNRGGGEEAPQLSADGRRILFTSRSSGLVDGQSGPVAVNLFVYDRTTGETELVSRSFASPTRTTATRFALRSQLAADGSAVAFASDAPDLVPRDFNQQVDAFAADLP